MDKETLSNYNRHYRAIPKSLDDTVKSWYNKTINTIVSVALNAQRVNSIAIDDNSKYHSLFVFQSTYVQTTVRYPCSMQ
jgi:hypothetical protein